MKHVRELYVGLTRNADGTFSSTKFWQAVGYITATWVIVYLTMLDKIEFEYFLAYLTAATAARSFQNYLTRSNNGTSNHGRGAHRAEVDDGRAGRNGAAGADVRPDDDGAGRKTTDLDKE